MQGNGTRKGHRWLTNQIHQGESDEFTKPKSTMELRIEASLSQERRRIEPARIAASLLSPGAWTAAKWWRQCNPSPPGDVTSQGRWLSCSVSCYEVYSCPHATIPTSLPSTISWCKSSPLYSSRTNPQFFVQSNHSQKPQDSLRNTRAITNTHTFPMEGSTEVVCGYSRHQGACNTSLQRPQREFLTNKLSKESRKSKRKPLPYLHIYFIKTHLAILRDRHLAILGCISMQIIGVKRETFMHAAKLQLLVVANCNLLDYIQSLQAQSSWIDAKSGIATDFDTNYLVPKRKTQPTAACWMLLVHAYKWKSLTVCNGIREYVHESCFSGFKRSLWPQAIHECCVCPNYLTPFIISISLLCLTHPTWIRKVMLPLSLFLLFQISFQLW
jgi:hypothetical protein